MKKLRTFWYVLTRSASDPAYYSDVLRTKMSYSLKFFFLLLFLLSIVDCILFRMRDIPKLISDIDQESTHLVLQIPDSFSVAYSPNGTLTTHGITLPFTFGAGDIAKSYGSTQGLVTIAANETPVPTSFVTLTPTRIIPQGDSTSLEKPRVIVLKDVFETTPWSLNKKQIEEKRVQFIASLPKLSTILMGFIFPFWYTGMLLATLVTLFVLTILANSFAWIMGIRMPLIKTFQLGLHAIGVATLLDVVKYALLPQSNISLVIPAYLGIIVLVFWSFKSRYIKVKMNS